MNCRYLIGSCRLGVRVGDLYGVEGARQINSRGIIPCLNARPSAQRHRVCEPYPAALARRWDLRRAVYRLYLVRRSFFDLNEVGTCKGYLLGFPRVRYTSSLFIICNRAHRVFVTHGDPRRRLLRIRRLRRWHLYFFLFCRGQKKNTRSLRRLR